MQGLTHLCREGATISICGTVERGCVPVTSNGPIGDAVCTRCMAMLSVQEMNRLIGTPTPVGEAVKRWAYTAPAWVR